MRSREHLKKKKYYYFGDRDIEMSDDRHSTVHTYVYFFFKYFFHRITSYKKRDDRCENTQQKQQNSILSIISRAVEPIQYFQMS